MRRLILGQSGIEVSEICLGTMTWGTQNTEAEAHGQIAHALERGVTFWDTAEMYPTNPVTAEGHGNTERIIGAWFAKAGGRDRVQLATKISGRGSLAPRDITGAEMRRSVEGSLRRLNTDYVDLYQMHWPNRPAWNFRRNWDYRPSTDRAGVLAHMEDVLATAADLVAEGKVRAFGLSNDTVWGAAQWLRLADQGLGPRMVTVQNEYSLLCRLFDTDWAELAAMENMPLLAFSPLAAGMLTGKYSGDATPVPSRRAATPDLGGRINPRALAIADAYVALAREHGLEPAAMAIAFCLDRPFPCIPIIGATTMEQLRVNLSAAGLKLSDAVKAGIDSIHRANPLPY